MVISPPFPHLYYPGGSPALARLVTQCGQQEVGPVLLLLGPQIQVQVTHTHTRASSAVMSGRGAGLSLLLAVGTGVGAALVPSGLAHLCTDSRISSSVLSGWGAEPPLLFLQLVRARLVRTLVTPGPALPFRERKDSKGWRQEGIFPSHMPLPGTQGGAGAVLLLSLPQSWLTCVPNNRVNSDVLSR